MLYDYGRCSRCRNRLEHIIRHSYIKDICTLQDAIKNKDKEIEYYKNKLLENGIEYEFVEGGEKEDVLLSSNDKKDYLDKCDSYFLFDLFLFFIFVLILFLVLAFEMRLI